MTATVKADVPDTTTKEIVALLRRCDTAKPDKEDVAALRRQLQETPDMWRPFGDMGRMAENIVIEGRHTTAVVRESMKAGMEVQRRELGIETATPLERALIDHVALCWLRLQSLELDFSSNLRQEHTFTLAEHMDRRLNAAQKRYLRACETLARIRRLAVPPVQINVGEKQVNLVTSGAL